MRWVQLRYNSLNSAMTPAAVAEADPSMEGMVSMATAQCATASIITLFLARSLQQHLINGCRRDRKVSTVRRLVL